MVVVARWFGGIKLGAGGLVRAYGGAASECLRNAAKTPLIELAQIAIACGFEHVGAVHQLIAQFGAEKRAETFASDGLHFAVELPRDRVAALQNALRDATRGQARIEEGSE
jgi:putative IMPACT (imprinted ancient) family translation regulator